MGISAAGVRFVLEGKSNGANFDRILTLGRMEMTASPRRLKMVLAESKFWPLPGGDAAFFAAVKDPLSRFEVMAKWLGAKTVDSCDVSDFEGATRIHDLNLPIPPG